jgi:hypothetical protein
MYLNNQDTDTPSYGTGMHCTTSQEINQQHYCNATAAAANFIPPAAHIAAAAVLHAAAHFTTAVKRARAVSMAADFIQHVICVTSYALPPLAWLVRCV